jgi:hypothetical protein
VRGITLTLALSAFGPHAQAQKRPARAAADTPRVVPLGSDRFRRALKEGTEQRNRFVKRITALSSSVLMSYWEVAEYQDEHRFISTVGSGGSIAYGPIVRVAASPFLDHFQKPKDFDASGDFGFLVALVDVTPPGAGELIGGPYKGLKLRAAGKYCVYLAHTRGGGDAAWKAFVLPANGTDCVRPVDDTFALPVDYVKSGGRRDDYPDVARFGEDANDQPIIGIPCADAICWITPTAAKAKEPSHKGKNRFLDSKREGQVALWHDDQELSMKNPIGGFIPWGRATVTPVPDLESKSSDDFAKDFVPVAWIWLAEDPKNTKYGEPVGGSKTWGMKQGLNQLELMYIAPGKWKARAVQLEEDGSKPIKPSTSSLIVTYKRHPDVWIPGTVRFSWLVADEGVWVPCDQGCCQVDADR